jgi:hypothetical protein
VREILANERGAEGAGDGVMVEEASGGFEKVLVRGRGVGTGGEDGREGSIC